MDNEYWDPKCTRPSDLVRPVRLDATGELGPTRGQARGPGWRRTSRGWYVPAEVGPEPVEQRILEQSVRLPTCGALTGWANLRWRGGRFFDGTDDGGRVQLPVPFVLGGWADIGHDDRIVVSRERFWPHEIEVVGGVRCAIAERALFDEMRRRLPRFRPGVVAADMAFAAGLTTLDRMRAYIATRNGWTGVPGARKALGLACEDSRSPQESRMRLVWVLDAGLPAPKCNVPVFDLHGNLIGVPDLFDPVAGLVGEYDGADHQLRGPSPFGRRTRGEVPGPWSGVLRTRPWGPRQHGRRRTADAQCAAPGQIRSARAAAVDTRTTGLVAGPGRLIGYSEVESTSPSQPGVPSTSDYRGEAGSSAP